MYSIKNNIFYNEQKSHKKEGSLRAAAVVYPDVTEEEVVCAAKKVPELAQIATTLHTLLPKLGKEMEVNLTVGSCKCSEK